MAEVTKQYYCWQCDEPIVGEKFESSVDPWWGKITEDDYLCEQCFDAGVDSWLNYINS